MGRNVPLNDIAGAEETLQALKLQVGPDDPLPQSVADLPAYLSHSEDTTKKVAHPQHRLADLVHKANQVRLLASTHS